MSEAAVETPANEVAFAGSYEAPAEEAAVEETPAAEAEAGTETEQPAAEAPQEQSAPADFRNDPEVLDFIRSEVEAITAARQAGTEHVAQDPAEELDLDLFADDGGKKLADFIRNTVQEAVRPIAEPLTQARVQAEAEEGKQLVADAIASIDVGGDFDREAAADLFALYRDEAVQRYGVTNRALEYAADKAARRQRAIEDAAEKRGAERYKNELAAIGDAPRETGAGSQGVRSQTFDSGDELSIARKWST